MTKAAALLATPLAALLATGCHDFDHGPTGGGPLSGSLALEIRDTADIEIVPGSDGVTMTVTLSLSSGFGVAPEAEPLSGQGRIEPLPEAGATLYTAKLAGPAQSDGPCGAEPVSLALSLHRQGANAPVHGGLSAYCGADQYYGVPVRVLRLAGELPLQ